MPRNAKTDVERLPGRVILVLMKMRRAMLALLAFWPAAASAQDTSEFFWRRFSAPEMAAGACRSIWAMEMPELNRVRDLVAACFSSEYLDRPAWRACEIEYRRYDTEYERYGIQESINALLHFYLIVTNPARPRRSDRLDIRAYSDVYASLRSAISGRYALLRDVADHRSRGGGPNQSLFERIGRPPPCFP